MLRLKLLLPFFMGLVPGLGWSQESPSRGPASNLHDTSNRRYSSTSQLASPLRSDRDYSLGIDTAEISMTSNSSSNTTATNLNLGGYFGWNMTRFELGPKLAFSVQSSGSTTVTSVGIGAFGDYNFVPNTSGKEVVYAGTLAALFQQTSSSGSSSTSSITADLGGAIKWYAFKSSNAALRLALVYEYQKSMTSSGSTMSGPVARAGFQVYF